MNALLAITMVRRAKMPNSCWGRYSRVGAVVVDVDVLVGLARTEPTMLSDRARGVVKVLETWERCHSGGEQSAEARAERAAMDVRDAWNATHDTRRSAWLYRTHCDAIAALQRWDVFERLRWREAYPLAAIRVGVVPGLDAFVRRVVDGINVRCDRAVFAAKCGRAVAELTTAADASRDDIAVRLDSALQRGVIPPEFAQLLATAPAVVAVVIDGQQGKI